MPNYFKEAKVRRANSCPEMKKNSPSNTFSATIMNRPTKPSVPEEKDEDGEEFLEKNSIDSSTSSSANRTSDENDENGVIDEPKLKVGFKILAIFRYVAFQTP